MGKKEYSAEITPDVVAIVTEDVNRFADHYTDLLEPL
jgi:hypothetical protein